MTRGKIVSWNVNSVRARLPHLLMLLANESPDIVLLQETKCEDSSFPIGAIQDAGYNLVLSGQKARNGVAIISKYPCEDVSTAFVNKNHNLTLHCQKYPQSNPQEARFIESFVFIEHLDLPLRVSSIYVPNGGVSAAEEGLNLPIYETERFKYKMSFIRDLMEHLLERQSSSKYDNEVQVFGGDYNIAPEAKDVYDPISLDGTICFHPLEREIWQELRNLTRVKDLMEDVRQTFTWWDYRAGAVHRNLGMRIDHFLMPVQQKVKILDTRVLIEYRTLERPSDHAPIMTEFTRNK